VAVKVRKALMHKHARSRAEHTVLGAAFGACPFAHTPYSAANHKPSSHALVVMLVFGKELVERELGNGKQINNLQDTERVNKKEYDKPPRIAPAAGVPQSQPLPKDRPNRGQQDQTQKRRRPKRHIDKPPLLAPLM